MLHLRALCPPEQTDAVLDVLRGHRGVTHIVVLRGVAVQPEGDVVEATVAREAADEVVEQICALGVDHSGGVTLEQLDTALSDSADEARVAAPGEEADAVVWQELVARTGEESRLNVTFLAFLVFATLLAAVGVITDSPVTIVGAMVVGPEFGPLAAVSVGLVRRRWDLLRQGVQALAIGFPVAIVLTAGLTLLGHATGLFDARALQGDHQVDFVYEVGPWSLIVALLAGAAGMLSMMSAKSTALVGVFISVTTVPAAGYVAVGAVLGEWDRSLASLAQLAVNLIGIVAAAALVLWLRRGSVGDPASERPLVNG